MTTCPSCGATAAGKFCSSCGAPLEGAACAVCRAALTPGAKFCHRCGTPAGATAPARPAASQASGVGTVLPWAVAAIALLALIALVAGQRFGRPPQNSQFASPASPGAVRAPDISTLTPEERAERLYDRVMSAAERGLVDSVAFFVPMAIQSYAALDSLSIDQRYDLGRLAEVGGDAALAGAQADTILQAEPRHLLGLLLASRAARLRGDEAAARRHLDRLAQFETTERARSLPEYLLHQNDIDMAMAEWRAARGGNQ